MSFDLNLAAQVPSKGAPLELVTRLLPRAGPHDVVIRNKAIAINHIDSLRQDTGFMIRSYPTILGSDVTGVVHEVGSAITAAFKSGDRVLGFTDSFDLDDNDRGTHQTYTVLRDDCVTKFPDALDFEHAAMFPTSVATSSMALFNNFGLSAPSASSLPLKQKTNEGILIWGGAGSVGSMAIQISKLLGFTVYATASPQNHAYLKTLGATQVFDYHSPTVVDAIVAAALSAGIKIKYAIDTVAHVETTNAAAEILHKAGGGPGGKLVRVLPLGDGLLIPEGVAASMVRVETIWEPANNHLAKWVFGEFLPFALEQKKIVASPELQVIEGGIGSLQKAVDIVKAGVRAKKVVVKVE